MKDKLVVLECFSDEVEAAVAKGFLEASGITACIFDDDPARQYSLRIGSNLNFGFRLMVDSSDFELARELLKNKEVA